MIPWDILSTALEELDVIHNQLSQARARERTVRFHHLLRTRMIGANRGEHIGNVIELAEGFCIIHWLHDPKSVGLYSSSLSMRIALGVGTREGGVTLSLQEASEREVHDSRRATTRGHLTPTERNVLVAVSHGLTNQQIGDRLNLSMSSVKNALHRGCRALGVSTRTQAALLVRDLGITEASSDSADGPALRAPGAGGSG